MQTTDPISLKDRVLGLFLRYQTTDLGGATWFLLVLFEVEVLFRLFACLAEKLGTQTVFWVLAAASGAASYALKLHNTTTLPYMLDLALMGCLYFGIGVFLARTNVRQLLFRGCSVLIPVCVILTYYFGHIYFRGRLPMNWPSPEFQECISAADSGLWPGVSHRSDFCGAGENKTLQRTFLAGKANLLCGGLSFCSAATGICSWRCPGQISAGAAGTADAHGRTDRPWWLDILCSFCGTAEQPDVLAVRSLSGDGFYLERKNKQKDLMGNLQMCLMSTTSVCRSAGQMQRASSQDGAIPAFWTLPAMQPVLRQQRSSRDSYRNSGNNIEGTLTGARK